MHSYTMQAMSDTVAAQKHLAFQGVPSLGYCGVAPLLHTTEGMVSSLRLALTSNPGLQIGNLIVEQPLSFPAGHVLPLYLLLFSHICADYLCQSKRFVYRKRRENSYFLFHIFLIWLFAFLLFFPYRSGKAIAVVTVLAISHFAVDKSKIRLKKRRPGINKKILNVSDQCVHFLLIFLAWRVFLFNLPLPFFFSGHPRILNYMAVSIIVLIIYKGIAGLSEKEENK